MKGNNLPSSWRNTTLGEVAAPVPNAIVDGPFGSNLKTSDYVEEGVPVLQGKNITNDSFRWFDVRFISDQKATELKRSSVRVGDILIIKIGSIGYSAIVENLNGFEFAIIPANLAKVTPDTSKVDLVYLHKWLTSIDAKRYFISVASKTAQPALSLGKIKSLPLPLPPLEEQRRIAKVLDRAEALRAKRRAALAQLDTLTQSIFLDLFGDPMMNHKGWKTCLLENIAKKITDGTHKTPIYKDSGIEFLSAKDLKDGGIAWGTGKFISEAEHRELIRRCNPEIGDILLAKSGSLGNVAIIDRPHEFSLFESLCLIKHDRDQIDGQFLVGLLRNPSMLAHLLGKNKGVAIKHLHLIDVRNLRIPLPPTELQREFARHITAVEKLKRAQRASLAELDALFTTLQHRAFRGKL